MNKSISLAQQVRQKITKRIIFGSVLFVCMFIITTIYDLYVNIHQLSASLNSTSSELSNYITSQELIDNQQAVFFRLKKMSEGSIIYQWIQPNDVLVTPTAFKKVLLRPSLSWNYFYKIPSVGVENIGYLKFSGSLLNDSSMIRSLLIRASILLLFLLGH